MLQATGTVSDDPSVFFDRYVKVYAIPTSMVSSCPATPANAIDLSYAASAQGGKTVSSGAPVTGSFSVPIAFTPDAPGGFLLCGYLTEGFNSADATASHNVDVTSSATSAAETPKSLRAPKVKRSGRASCAIAGAGRRSRPATPTSGASRASARPARPGERRSPARSSAARSAAA